MSKRSLIGLAAAALLSMLVTACGGSDDGGMPQTQPAPASPPPQQGIGPTGGTVSGPNGSQIVVPPNALAQATSIAIAQSGAGAPALPAGMAMAGQMYAFTPHGTTFSTAATITVPFDPSQVPAGAQVMLLKTNAAQTGWENVSGASVSGNLITAQVTSFSWLAPAFAVPPLIVRSRATRIATGSAFSVAVRNDGTLWLWGNPNVGVAGATANCVIANSLDAPCRIVGPTGIRAVAAGGSFVLALRSDGQVVQFGYVPGGAGMVVNADVAQPIPGLSNVTQVAAGWQHAMARRADGTVMTWGASGLLGDGSTVGRATPGPVTGLSNVVAIAAAGNRSIALTGGGGVWTWGEDGPGLGLDVRAPFEVVTATQLATLTGITGIAAGSYSSIFGNSTGSTWYAGNRLKVSDPVTIITPTLNPDLAGAAAAAAGVSSLTASSTAAWAIVVDASGKPHGFGTPSDVGNVNSLSNIVEIAAGSSSHALFVDSSGAVWAWGQNHLGQIGDGTHIDRLTPVAVGLNLN